MFEKPTQGWVVDGATEGNPGMSEYRCIDLATGKIIFHHKIGIATNNITEFLAVVHAMAKALLFNFIRRSKKLYKTNLFKKQTYNQKK